MNQMRYKMCNAIELHKNVGGHLIGYILWGITTEVNRTQIKMLSKNVKIFMFWFWSIGTEKLIMYNTLEIVYDLWWISDYDIIEFSLFKFQFDSFFFYNWLKWVNVNSDLLYWKKRNVMLAIVINIWNKNLTWLCLY